MFHFLDQQSKGVGLSVVMATLSFLSFASAQEAIPLPSAPPASETDLRAPPNLFPETHPGDDLDLRPETPFDPPAASPYKLQLSPVIAVKPILPPLKMIPGLPGGNFSAPSVYVKKIQFHGNHVFSSRVLGKVVRDYVGRQDSAEDIDEARQRLTTFYVSHGYINSGAIVEDQNPANGVVTFRLVEGRLTTIALTGNKWFRGYWLRHEMRRAAGQPLNFDRLKEELELLRQNPMIAQVNAELRPGGVPGESILDAQIKDTQPFHLSFDFDNGRPPSVGSEIFSAHAADLNLTGNNDPLRVNYGILQSTHNQGFRASGLDNVDGSYSIGFTPWDTVFQINGSKSDTAIIEAPFTGLDISSRLEDYGYAIRQPLHETLRDDLAVSLSFASERDKTFLRGLPFSLSRGADGGISDVSAIRCTQEFVDRSQVHVLSLRSTFSVGIAALGATINGSGIDSHFFSWLGQGQYIRRLHNTDNLLVVRLNAQFADRPLLAPEEFSIGGAQSVRGYRENEVLRDNGVFGSLEIRLPVIHGKTSSEILTLAPFVDLALGWDNPADHPTGTGSSTAAQSEAGTAILPSAGIALIVTPTSRVHAELSWGYGFNRKYIANDKTDPQDYGLAFTLTVDAF